MRRLVFLGVVFAVAYACVPADDRPPPATMTMTVSGSAALHGGVVTADGWTVTFDRVLVGLGNESFGDGCTVYGEADYGRVLDVRRGDGQRLGVLHGLGQCDLRFRLAVPGADAVLGDGVTADDENDLRAPETDPYIPNQSGASVDLAGTATRDGVTKHFRLQFRRRVRFQRCSPTPPPGDASFVDLQTNAFAEAGAPAVDLAQNQLVTYDLRVEPEAVLRDDVNPSSAALRFDAFAKADTNGDGTITLDELRAVPLSAVRDAGAFDASTYDFDDAGLLERGRPIVIASLGDFVYELLFPTLPRFRDEGWCANAPRR